MAQFLSSDAQDYSAADRSSTLWRHAEDSFDVVVPSLPGYGFSDRPTVKGFTDRRSADLFARLISQELGYQRFAAHGGDIGGGVTEALAITHPDSLIGIHLTDIPYWHLFTLPQAELVGS